MSTSREIIFARLRDALKSDRNSLNQADLAARLAAPARNTVPARTRGLDIAGRIALFSRFARAVDTTVEQLSSWSQIPEATANYLAHKNLPAKLVLADVDSLTGLDWAGRALGVRTGAPGIDDQVTVTPVFAAIAETGSLMVVSGKETPHTLNFIPETQIAAVRADQLVATMEDGWDRLRAAYGPGVMPRALGFVTGPSRTADINLTLYLGAHGPRNLHILIIDGD
jgi:L-lactate dehydrogenase complex protein LldG